MLIQTMQFFNYHHPTAAQTFPVSYHVLFFSNNAFGTFFIGNALEIGSKRKLHTKIRQMEQNLSNFRNTMCCSNEYFHGEFSP